MLSGRLVGWVAVNLCRVRCVDREVGKARHRDVACLAPRGWNDRGTVLGAASSARQAGPPSAPASFAGARVLASGPGVCGADGRPSHTSAWRLKPCSLTQRCWVGGADWLGTVCKLSTFCPAGPQRNAVGAGRRLQGPERGLRIGVGQIAHPLLFNEIAFACQQPHEALYDPTKYSPQLCGGAGR